MSSYIDVMAQEVKTSDVEVMKQEVSQLTQEGSLKRK